MANIQRFGPIFLLFRTIILSINSVSCEKSLLTNQAALFVFGDSVFDVGNNNNINTFRAAQANVWPYGQTTFKFPTGRNSDGRLIPDFIAFIRGYDDTWLSDSEMEVAVREFFSSCGEVKDVSVYKEKGFCYVRIKGIDAAEKVRELDGSYFGNKAVVGVLTKPPRHSTHNRFRNYGPRLLAANHMTAE